MAIGDIIPVVVCHGYDNSAPLQIVRWGPTTIALVTLHGYSIPGVGGVDRGRVRMGAHGILHGRGKTPIGRGL